MVLLLDATLNLDLNECFSTFWNMWAINLFGTNSLSSVKHVSQFCALKQFNSKYSSRATTTIQNNGDSSVLSGMAGKRDLGRLGQKGRFNEWI